jgi:serine/threonine-protein kinase
MIFHKLTAVPIYPSSNPPLFQVKLLVTWDSGSTAKIDGAQAVAFTSFRGHPQSVPNVIGLTESAASSALAASGYPASVVSSGYSTAPSGSVIVQDPPAGTIESPGSGVNLTLSTGSVTVPKVISLTQTEAIHEIAAVGLVPAVISQQGCTDPGVVFAQNPAGGTGVSLGSTVSITVHDGKTANGACAPN